MDAMCQFRRGEALCGWGEAGRGWREVGFGRGEAALEGEGAFNKPSSFMPSSDWSGEKWSEGESRYSTDDSAFNLMPMYFHFCKSEHSSPALALYIK